MKIKIVIPGLIHRQTIENEEDIAILKAVLKKVEKDAESSVKVKGEPEEDVNERK